MITDKVIGILTSVFTPVLTLLIHENVLSSGTATDIGSIIAGVIVGYHGNAIAQNRRVRNAAQKPKQIRHVDLQAGQDSVPPNPPG